MKFTTSNENYGVVEEVIGDQVLDDVDRLQKVHQYDPNLSIKETQILDEAVKTGNVEKALEIDESFTKESPYEAVRAAVRETDAEETANTVRAWFLGFIFVTLSSGINMFLIPPRPMVGELLNIASLSTLI